MELIFEARALDPTGEGPASRGSASSIDPSTPGSSKQDPSKQDPSKQDDTILRELSRVVPVETLAPRYRART